jgi:hypothetical protein
VNEALLKIIIKWLLHCGFTGIYLQTIATCRDMIALKYKSRLTLKETAFCVSPDIRTAVNFLKKSYLPAGWVIV